VGEIGGTVGTAISAAFLFLIALINIIFLVQAIKERNRLQSGNTVSGEDEERPIHGGGMMVRIIGPVLKAVDRPWKLYPVGLLFGLGKLLVSRITRANLARLRYSFINRSPCHLCPGSERPKWPIAKPRSYNHLACKSLLFRARTQICLMIVPLHGRNVVCRFARFRLDALRLCFPIEVISRREDWAVSDGQSGD
jgi:hypothetical protein